MTKRAKAATPAVATPERGASDGCDGVLVVHYDGTRECLDFDCTGGHLDHGPADVSCQEVFEGDCPRCGPTG